MRNPIDQLISEHEEIMAEIAHLRREVRELEIRGESALPEALPVFASVSRMMATQLLTHARKEDEALFPALEAALGGAGGPTAVMRQEHREIHAQAARFRQTVYELNEIEHPAIVAGGARLRELTTGGAPAEELRATAFEVIRLLDLHFGKEEDILFPMARQVLPPETLRAVARRMEEIEAGAAV